MSRYPGESIAATHGPTLEELVPHIDRGRHPTEPDAVVADVLEAVAR
ncbi:MAG: hypothetical protein AAGA17_16365 [Actinomycetota bacterium]